MTNMESMIANPTDTHYYQIYGELALAGHETTMPRCACVACNSCTCACSCRAGEQQVWEWPDC
ncbi:FibroRumin family radical SAM-modified Cys-rich RiPP [Thiorhodovibrio frisius]|uniref:FibroRumin family radical SAM-modified Cys-rich RiPP n=1 Tax=Thiorhodovibrio frisius TaxID=631362 RepID=UPI001180D587